MSQQTVVIVGASLAGAKAAAELREHDFEGHVILLGAEPDLPYERPPLSKDLLKGDAAPEDGRVFPESFYAEHGITLELGVAVTSFDPGERTVTLADGRGLRYDSLLLTTGSQPRRLDVPGANLQEIYYLRTLPEAIALRDRVAAGGRLVVVGGGWIGAEVAAGAREKGLDVAIVDPAPLPNERIFGPEIASFYRDVHASHGVDLHFGDGVEAFQGDAQVNRVLTQSGTTLEADFVVVGVGITPRSELAVAAGLSVDNGIVVDRQLRTSAEGVWAAGDVANADNAFYGTRFRVEHWANALNQGPAAARSILGAGEPWARVPYFYSDQYDVGMEYSGYTTAWDEVVFRGSRDDGAFVAFWLDGGRVVAGMNVNVWDVNDHVQALIRSRQVVDVDKLVDLDTPLESVIGQ